MKKLLVRYTWCQWSSYKARAASMSVFRQNRNPEKNKTKQNSNLVSPTRLSNYLTSVRPPLTLRILAFPVDDSSKRILRYEVCSLIYAHSFKRQHSSAYLSGSVLTCGILRWFKTCHRNHRSFFALLRTRNVAAMANSSGRPLGNILLWEENKEPLCGSWRRQEQSISVWRFLQLSISAVFSQWIYNSLWTST